MARYVIIDEPKSRSWGESLIVDPSIILIASILVPIIWNPPMFGRFWIPLLWMLLNGYALGSATFRQEVITLLVGSVGWLTLFFGVSGLHASGYIPFSQEIIAPYLRLFLFGIFFLTLYLVVFRQSSSYQLYNYSRGERT